MKTHILRCESFDSCASLEDRLKWVKAGRVLLVMPEKDPPALSRQDFIRLKRKAGRLHADLALVSQDKTLGETAGSAGLAVFNSNEDARQEDWLDLQTAKPLKRRPEVVERIRSYRARETKPLPGWGRWLAFVLAILAILALIGMLLPGATVEMYLPREEQSAELTAPASVEVKIPDLIAGVPLYSTTNGDFWTIEVFASIQQKTSGKITVEDKPATGWVVLTNLTDQTLEIPVGTIVRTIKPQYRYSTNQSGSLPAGPGTTISLPVVAMDGRGPGGNLPPGGIVEMAHPLGLSIAVTNPGPISGGTQKTGPALAQADLQSADVAIKEALVQAAIEESSDFIPEGAVLIRDSIVVDHVRGGSAHPPDDRILSSFEVSEDAFLTGNYYFEDDLEQWAVLALDASLPTDRVPVPANTLVQTISINYIDETTVNITIQASRQVIPAYDAEAIAAQVRGLKPEDAVSLIHTLIPGSQPVITLNPSWWPWLPFIPQRIDING